LPLDIFHKPLIVVSDSFHADSYKKLEEQLERERVSRPTPKLMNNDSGKNLKAKSAANRIGTKKINSKRRYSYTKQCIIYSTKYLCFLAGEFYKSCSYVLQLQNDDAKPKSKKSKEKIMAARGYSQRTSALEGEGGEWPMRTLVDVGRGGVLCRGGRPISNHLSSLKSFHILKTIIPFP